MGLFDRLGLTTRRMRALSTTVDLGIKSPWTEGSLSQISLYELMGLSEDDVADVLPLGRAEAMRIPAVSKARNLLVSTIMRFPLVSLDTTGPLATQPTFLQRTNGPVGPQERMAWTVDDAIFHGLSLWATERAARTDPDRRQPILNAARVPFDDWKIEDGKVLINDKAVTDDEYLLFNFPFEGLLTVGDRTLRGARDTELAWTARIKNPIFLTELRFTEEVDQAEADEWEAAYVKKHRAGKPSVGVTPPGAEVHTHGVESGDSSLYMENRNAVRTDIGSFVNVRASMLDGTAGVDSLTYSTTEGEKNSFYEFDLPFWTAPIEERLSMDDVVPRGTRTRFDKYEAYNTSTPTGAPTED